ncbi:hypothetical protein [Ochrobactrum teleogrylli]
MSIIENTSLQLNGLEHLFVQDDALEAEIRAHLRFTRWLGRIMIGFLFVLFSVVAFHFSAISI